MQVYGLPLEWQNGFSKSSGDRFSGYTYHLTDKASLGCGNPTALAELKTGEVVLDLGSGGDIDGLLSARRVGQTGKAYGLDMY